MASDPLDHLQSMFPSIEGDVIAIVYAESDKDISSTVEKLLQLVPVDNSKSEYPTLLSTIQPAQRQSYVQVLSPPRSSSGPASTAVSAPPAGRPSLDSSNSTWQGQQRNKRLQGPTHIPPNAKQHPRQQTHLGGNSHVALGNVGQTNQQKLQTQQQLQHQQQLYKSQSQSILGKRPAPGKKTAVSHNLVGSGIIEGGREKENERQDVFYQMGGSAVNSMPALGSLNPPPLPFPPSAPSAHVGGSGSPYFPLPPNVHPHQQQVPSQAHIRGNFPPPLHPLPPQHRAQAPYRVYPQRQAAAHVHQQKQWHPPPPAVGSGRGGSGGGLYGYPDVSGTSDQFYRSWMSPGHPGGDYIDQFYDMQGQQTWPNIGGPEMQQNQDKTRNRLTDYRREYLPSGMTSLLGDPSARREWPLHTPGSNSGTIGDHRGNLDPISALLQPPMPNGSFGRHGPIQSEPSLSSNAIGQHQRQFQEGESHNGDATRANRQGRRNVDAFSEGKEGKSDIDSSVASDKSVESGGSSSLDPKGATGGGPRKLIILRGLPGSGKTTLARSLVGSDGVICCTDDFFVRNGQYQFDPALLEENHEKNRIKAHDAMKTGNSPVIIDNTNTNAWEMKPYVLLAMEHGYAVEILEPDTPWRFKTAELARRNSHGVSRQSLEKMLERYDHRVTLESIIVSQPPERKQQQPQQQQRPTNSDSSKNANSVGGRQAVNGGQKGGKAKVSLPTPRQQTGSDDVDHAPTHQKHPAVSTTAAGSSSAAQNRSGAMSPRPVAGKKGQRSNERPVSPRPTNQRNQRSKDNTSAKSGAEGSGVSVIGDGRPGDGRRRNAPQTQHQQGGQTSQAVSSNKSQTEQPRKGKKATQQAAGTRSAVPVTAAQGKKRSVSPVRTQSNKQTSQNTNGPVRNVQNDRHSEDGVMKKIHGRESDSSKKSRKSMEEDDDFLWDSSEETEILDNGVVRSEPVFMTDTPPAEMSFRPVPQVGKPLINGRSGGIHLQEDDLKRDRELLQQERQVPIFEVWNDSDDEYIDDSNGDGDVRMELGGREEDEEENPIPVAWLDKSSLGHDEGQTLPRTPEIANISQMSENGVSSGLVSAPSHSWERTQSARDLQDVNDHFNALIRRVQSANPVHRLSTLTEVSGSSQSLATVGDETFNVFTMSSLWGSGVGLLSSKMQLFDPDFPSSAEPADLAIKKSSPSVYSVGSIDSLSEKQKGVRSYYSMLDALVEEVPIADSQRGSGGGEDGIGMKVGSLEVSLVGESDRKTRRQLLEEAVVSTQDSVTIQEAIEDELKCSLRSKIIAELYEEIEKTSLKDTATEGMTEKDSHGLETRVDVETLLPRSVSDVEKSGMVVPPFNDKSASFSAYGKPFTEQFLMDKGAEQGDSLEMLTEKIFEEERLCPRQNLSTLQAAFQTAANSSREGSWKEVMSSTLIDVGVVGNVVSEGSLDDRSSGPASFEDPAIVTKVCLDGSKDSTQTPFVESLMSLQEISQVDIPNQCEPVQVFPSAFDEGLSAHFPLSSINPPAEDKSLTTSTEQTLYNSSFQSQTRGNDQLEVRTDISLNTVDGRDNGRGLSPAGLLSANVEEKSVNELSYAKECTPTPSATEPCADNDLQALSKDDSPNSSFNSDLRFLIDCFPSLDETYLHAILNMCERNVEDALSVLLFSHNEMETSYEQNFSRYACEEGSSNIRADSDQHLHWQQLGSSPEQQAVSSKNDLSVPMFTIGGGEEEAVSDESSMVHQVPERKFVSYFDDSCVNDEEIARALQEQLDHEASSSSDQLPSLAGETSITDKASDVTFVVGQSGRSSSYGSDEVHPALTGDENLELKLSMSLARQLQEMFGSVAKKLPFEGEMREEDMVVLLSKRAAREIYKKWLDTLQAKKIGYRVQSELSLTKDEALARQLQEEEESKVRGSPGLMRPSKLRHSTEPATLAAENFQTRHNSSPPQVGAALDDISGSPQTGGGLVEIMGEQMAQQVQENQLLHAEVVKQKAAPNLSLRLQLKDLYKQFPELEQPLINETLVRNKFEIEATVAELKELVLHPPPPAKVKKSTDGSGVRRSGSKPSPKSVRASHRWTSHGVGMLARRKLFKDEGKDQKANDEAVPNYQAMDDDHQNLSYIELRAEAALHAKERAENFMKAAHARGNKQWEVAQYYSQQGHLHTEKMIEANQRAAKSTLKHNYTSSDELDLHGLHVDEAITALQEKLTSCKGSKLRVVTGQGIHSKEGGARIRPAVIEYLQNNKYKVMYEKNAGVLTVKIK